jgi:CHAT domain-containing protein
LAYKKIKQFLNTYNALEEGIQIVESLRGKIVSGDEIKQKFAENWNKIYRTMVEVCLELAVNNSQYKIKALEYVERSKARNLFELLKNRDLESKVIAAKFELMPIEEILKALDENTAIIEWYFTDNSFYTFIITSKKPNITVWKSSQKDFVEIVRLATLYYQSYRENNEYDWQNSLLPFFQDLGIILNFDRLINMIPANCKHLILIPHRFLHLLPLHAFPLQDGNCLLDYLSQGKRFTGGVNYAPSCQIWYQVKNRKNTSFSSLFTIQNPTLDLQYTDIEVEVIKEFFDNDHTEILNKENANKEKIDSSTLQIANCIHFSCHGSFNFDEPWKSALILSKARVAEEQNLAHIRHTNLRGGGSFDLQKCLTSEEIFNLNLTQCRLVTLSACETGLTDIKSVSDEYIGLPSGFLYAGASNVVATLWTVNDLSTTFLMIKFYENLNQQLKKTSELNVANALQNAQLWLKKVDKKQLGEWLPNISLTDINHETQLEDWLSELQPNIKPFESPYYWAGFCAIGQ